jgi:hypothetical protein
MLAPGWAGDGDTMRSIVLATLGLLFFAHTAGGATWSVISFATSPQNAADVAAAADALMGSKVGQEFPGRLLLQANVADGDNPATHSFVPIYSKAADREAFVAKLQADPAWATFQETMTAKTQPVSTVLYQTVQRWGEISDDDIVWRLHMFDVADAAAFGAALDAFMNSETGKNFPGQVFLSAVQSGGLSPVSHAISVGQASEAAIEAWQSNLVGNADWQKYLDTSQASAEYLGNNLVRTQKGWGGTLDEVTAP